MNNDIRLELTFKSILQLETKINFCKSNHINKINIPCKGIIKKEFLNEVIEYIGENCKNFDVIYHYSFYHQYNKNIKNSYFEFLNFINKCTAYGNKELLIVSGSNKKKNFEVLDVLRGLKNEENFKINIGIAYNPYLKYYQNFYEDRLRLEKKLSSGLIKSIWLQFGTDIRLLESEINFLKESIYSSSNKDNQTVKIYGSLLIPSRQFISRFKFRPWKGVFISGKYLNSLENFYSFTKDLIEIYIDNNIFPLIETECSSKEKLEEIYNLLKL